MKQLLKNYKTTSSGALMIIGSIIHLVFAVKHGNADENAWTIASATIVGGIGLIFAGDSTRSSQEITSVRTDAASAVNSGNTEILTKPKP